MALAFDDIDFKNNRITINKSWDAVYSHAAKDTKTASSVRTIDVIPRVIELIVKLKKEKMELEMKTGHRDGTNMIFKTLRGQVPTNNAANKALRKLQASLGIDNPITFHGLRHSHASFLLSRGVDIYYISKRLGHANVSITLNVYSHLLNSASKRQANKSLEALESI
jgi:integrase